MTWWRRCATAVLVVGIALAGIAATTAGAASTRTSDFVALDAATGAHRWEAAPSQHGGGFGVLYANRSTVFAAQWDCLWIDEGKAASKSTALVAFDTKTGRERWRVAGIDNGWSGDAATVPEVRTAPDGPVPIWSSHSHILRALDPSTGAQLWKQSTGDLIPVAAGSDSIVLVTEPATAGYPQPDPTTVLVRDRRTGKVRARTTIAGAPTRTAVVLPGGEIAVPVIRADGIVVVAILDGATGRNQRELPVPAVVNGAALHITTTGTVLLVSGGGTAAVDADSGTVRWSVPATGWATPASVSTTFVSPTNLPLPRIDALDTMTGSVRWSGAQNTTLYAADAHQAVFVAANLWHAFGPATVVDTNTGATLWTSQFSDDQHLLVDHGSLYVSGGCPATLAD